MNRTLILAGVAACVITTPIVAQDGRQPSPDGTSATQVSGRYVGAENPTYQGGKWIEIVYGRPLKRGRDLWGSGADYGKKVNAGEPSKSPGMRKRPGGKVESEYWSDRVARR